MDKKELLEKIYDKYQMEVDRKDRLESKAIGYYTIMGIFFAGFLVIEPILLQNGLAIKITPKEIISVINYLFIGVYLVLFIITLIILHGNYKVKNRQYFDPISNWDSLVGVPDDKAIDAIKDNLIDIINYNDYVNTQMAKKLQTVNIFCIINGIITISIFIILIISYYL